MSKKQNNESKQFKSFAQSLQNTDYTDKRNIFRDWKEIISIENTPGCDAKVILKNNEEIFVELTTMDSYVGTNKTQSLIHSRNVKVFYPNNEEKDIFNNIAKLKQLSIDRKLIKVEKKDGGIVHHFIDKYHRINQKEIDLDKKYNIQSGHLINSLVRALMPKIKKYKTNDKNNVLVILNMANDSFEKIQNDRFIRLFLNYVFFSSLQEISLSRNKYFKNIQVFLKNKRNDFINENFERKFPLPSNFFQMLKFESPDQMIRKIMLVENFPIYKLKNRETYIFTMKESKEDLASMRVKLDKRIKVVLKEGTKIKISIINESIFVFIITNDKEHSDAISDENFIETILSDESAPILL